MNETSNTQTSNTRSRALGFLAAALLAAVMLTLLAGCGGDDSTSADSAVTEAIPAQGPVEISPQALSELAQKQTIYWIGEQPGTKLELTVTETGNLFVRYLDKDAKIGTRDPYLTVSTYPASPALELLQTEAQKTGARTEQLNGGGLVMVVEGQPTNVYLAYPGANYQVEVYDPDPERALGLIMTGEVEPVV